MIDMECYIDTLINLLRQRFGLRLLYIGLQGSYLRGEATDNSDIDIMVILDRLDAADLKAYRAVIESMDNADKSCGFICSRADLLNWNPMEICHLLHSTKDYFGVLRDFVPSYTQQDVRNFVKLSLNNLYHEICHRYIHASPEANRAHLPGTYKCVFFILQNLHYLTQGEFIGSKATLLTVLSGKDRMVLEHAMDMSRGVEFDFSESFELLLTWCQETLQNV